MADYRCLVCETVIAKADILTLETSNFRQFLNRMHVPKEE
jgi:hypothetical protein